MTNAMCKHGVITSGPDAKSCDECSGGSLLAAFARDLARPADTTPIPTPPVAPERVKALLEEAAGLLEARIEAYEMVVPFAQSSETERIARRKAEECRTSAATLRRVASDYEELVKDAERWRFWRPRYYGADFYYGDKPTVPVLLFQLPARFAVCADPDATTDHLMTGAVRPPVPERSEEPSNG